MSHSNINLSVIVPVFNGGDHIESFYLTLSDVLKNIGVTYEIIFVDDGSTDITLEKLIQMSQVYSFVKIISLSSNCGQHYALSNGIEKAKGEVILLLDDDHEWIVGQIPIFLHKLSKGYDLITCWRRRRNLSIIRRFGTWGVNMLLSVIIKKRIHDIGGPKAFGNKGGFLLYKCGSVLEVIGYLKHLKIYEMKINDLSRRYSRYNLRKILQLFFQILFVVFGYNVLRKYRKVHVKYMANV